VAVQPWGWAAGTGPPGLAVRPYGRPRTTPRTGCPSVAPYSSAVMIRPATEQDWPLIYPFYAVIMAEGRTYPFPEGQTLDQAPL
jgi:hypothetical protein